MEYPFNIKVLHNKVSLIIFDNENYKFIGEMVVDSYLHLPIYIVDSQGFRTSLFQLLLGLSPDNICIDEKKIELPLSIKLLSGEYKYEDIIKNKINLRLLNQIKHLYWTGDLNADETSKRLGISKDLVLSYFSLIIK